MKIKLTESDALGRDLDSEVMSFDDIPHLKRWVSESSDPDYYRRFVDLWDRHGFVRELRNCFVPCKVHRNEWACLYDTYEVIE